MLSNNYMVKKLGGRRREGTYGHQAGKAAVGVGMVLC